jgi:hypothetical protein
MSPSATGYNRTFRMTIPFQSSALCFSISVWAFQSASIAKAVRRLPHQPPCDTGYARFILVAVGSYPCVFFAELEEEFGSKIILLRRRGLFF